MVNAQSCLGDCRPSVLGNDGGCSLTLEAERLHQLPMSAPAHLADPRASSLGKGLPQALRDPDSLRAALSLGGEAPAWECSLGVCTLPKPPAGRALSEGKEAPQAVPKLVLPRPD